MLTAKLPNIDFEGLSEADVRGEVIDPLLRMLGYQSGTSNNILREQLIELRYPRMFLGRKKGPKDPVLRGRPDYICEVRGVSRWAIEAKPPHEEISRHDIEQAHSYSMHPELAAPLFVLCNGKTLLVFETNRGPASNPILSLNYPELQRHTYRLLNLFSPSAMASRFPVMSIDMGRPLASSLGSRAKIVGGFTRYDSVNQFFDEWPLGIPQPDGSNLQKLVGLQVSITGETCFRDEEFGICADVRMQYPHDSMRQFAETIGITLNRYTTRDLTISDNPDNPSIFEFTLQRTIPAGTRMYDITSWSITTLPVDVDVAWHAEAVGHLNGNSFIGKYSGRMIAKHENFFVKLKHWVLFDGTFELELKRI